MALLQISEPGKSQNPHEKKLYIGIDLGTTNSLVSIMRNGSPFVLKNNQGNELFPSIVTYKQDSVNIGEPKPDGESITCLLYTSPSPRDLSTSRMPSSA